MTHEDMKKSADNIFSRPAKDVGPLARAQAINVLALLDEIDRLNQERVYLEHTHGGDMLLLQDRLKSMEKAYRYQLAVYLLQFNMDGHVPEIRNKILRKRVEYMNKAAALFRQAKGE